VLAPSSSVGVSDGAATAVGVALPQAASDVTLTITNSAGQVVNTVDLGAQPAGNVPLTLTPKDTDGNALPDGTYTLSASATVNGKSTSVNTLAASQVQSVVQQSDGTAGLALSNGNTVALSSVAAIL